MTVIAIMGKALHQELQTRGIYELNPADCEAIIANVVKRSAEAAEQARAGRPDGGAH